MKLSRLLILMLAVIGLSSCNPSTSMIGVHKYDTVIFDLKDPPLAGVKPVPNVWVDTNMEVKGLIRGGTVQSRKPYHIRIDHTDNTFSLSALEIAKVKVVYDDGKIEGATKGLKLPIRILAKDYETVNSTRGGRIVKAKVNLLSGVLKDVITRDESLTLNIEGFFTTKKGVKETFTIDSHYLVRFDKGTRPLADR